MIYTIEIERIELRARHGCYDVEQTVGGDFTVDVRMEVEGEVEGDDVGRTVNYVEVFEAVKEQMAIPSRTIEHAAWRIRQAVMGLSPRILSVDVVLAKLAPPMGGKARSVSVTIRK